MTELQLLSITAIGTFLAAVGTCVAAVASWRASRAALASIKTQVILDFTDRDSDPRIGEATRRLWEFKNQSEEDIGTRFERLRIEDPDAWAEIDNDRRLVHKLWLRLMSVKQSGMISEKQLLTFLLKSQLDTIVLILEPLEQRKQGARFTEPAFDEYRRIRDNYDELFEQTFGVVPGQHR